MTKPDRRALQVIESFDREDIVSLTKEIDDAALDDRKAKNVSLRKSDNLYKLSQQEIEDLILQEHNPEQLQSRKAPAENWSDEPIESDSKYYDSVDVKLLESIERSYIHTESAQRPSSASSSSSSNSESSSSGDETDDDDPKNLLPPPYSESQEKSSAISATPGNALITGEQNL